MDRPAVIGIDASRLSVGQRTGTETYTYQLLSALARLDVDDPIRLYLNADQPPDLDPPFGESVLMPFPRLWTHGRLSWEMLRRPPGVLFVPAHVVPAIHPRTVVTIHDLGYLHEGAAHPSAQRRMLDWTTRWSCRAAAHIISISEATKRDLQSAYHVPGDRITVIAHGVDASFHPRSSAEITAVKQRYQLPSDYLLAVGTIHPRKNYGVLAEALRAVEQAALPHRLVIAGKRGWLADQVDQAVDASGMRHRVQFIDYVPQADLPALYSGAALFCFPSRYEGFGLPALEAMACGVPAIVSDRGSLPEVAGDAATIVDPTDANALGAAMVKLLRDGAARARLVERGRKRAAAFTWDHTARQTLDVLRAVRAGTFAADSSSM
jgi:glycosyltransferase involved in cell wall biosynthesis